MGMGVSFQVRYAYPDGMAETVNLKHARKLKAREAAEAKAAENRAKYGQTKAERARLAAESAKLRAVIDGAKKEE